MTRGTTDTDKSSKIALGVHSVIANSDDALSGAQPKRVDRGGDEGLVYEANDGGRLGGNGKFLNHWVLGGREFEPPRNGRLFSDDFSSDKWWKTPARYIYSHVSWSVGGAPLWFAPDDKTDYDYAGATFWSSFSYSPSRERPYKFVADVIYKNGEILPAEDAIGGTAALPVGANGMAPKTIKQDSLFITGGIDLGNRDFHVTFTASYLELDQHALGKDSAFQYAATVEKRIGGSNSWMTLSVSKDDGHDDGRNPTIVLGGVKVGLGGEDFGGVSQKLRDLAR